MAIPVTAGVRMIKYLTQIRSAINPINGLKSEGSFLVTSRSPAMEREIPSFEIRRGRSGAKKAEYISCDKWAKEIVITFPDWNFFVFVIYLIVYQCFSMVTDSSSVGNSGFVVINCE